MMLNVILVLCFFSGTGDMPPDVIRLNGAGVTRPAVDFPHLLHAGKGIPCSLCHHADGNDGNISSCRSCHLPDGGNGTLPLRDAHHRQCVSCHRTGGVRGRKVPLYCGECHRK